MALTPKQQIFVNEYLKCWNATEAARRAGYAATNGSLRNIGCVNLTKANIKAEIDQRLKDNAMSANEVISRLADIARGNLKDFALVKSPDDLIELDNKAALVKKYKRKITHNQDGDTFEDIEIELYSAHDALRDLGKYHALFTDKVQSINLDIDYSKLTDEQLTRLAAGENPANVIGQGKG